MKTQTCRPCNSMVHLTAWLVPVALAIQPAVTRAVTVTNLDTFSYSSGGATPEGGLALSGGVLYGVTLNGGSSSDGTLFKILSNGTLDNDFFSFGGGIKGANPVSGLVASNGVLYGTTEYGGTNGTGMVFRINTDGTDFTNLYSFTAENGSGYNSDGANPSGGLILNGNMLYGTTPQGGDGVYPYGTIYRVNTDGSGFTNLYNFNGPDGETPEGIMLLSSNTLYGTTAFGGTGSGGYGNLFKINTDGSGFTNFYNMNSGSGDAPYSLALSGNTLYGVCSVGGSDGVGTIFQVNTDGMDFTNLFNFPSDDSGNAPDGAEPWSIVLSGNTLYGTTSAGGTLYEGALFAMTTDTMIFTNFFNFDYNVYGAVPKGQLLLSGTTLYGITTEGSASGAGTVFAVAAPVLETQTIPIPLNISFNGTAVILSWTNPVFSLYAAPLATGTYTNVPNATSPYTNAITGSQQFFELLSN